MFKVYAFSRVYFPIVLWAQSSAIRGQLQTISFVALGWIKMETGLLFYVVLIELKAVEVCPAHEARQ